MEEKMLVTNDRQPIAISVTAATMPWGTLTLSSYLSHYRYYAHVSIISPNKFYYYVSYQAGLGLSTKTYMNARRKASSKLLFIINESSITDMYSCINIRLGEDMIICFFN